MPRPLRRPRAIRATPQTSCPWPSKARRTGPGPVARVEAADRPLGAVVPLARPELLRDELLRGFLDRPEEELGRLVEERC